MARRNRIGLHFEGWKDYVAKLDELGGTDYMKKGVEKALIESKKHINPKIEQAMTHLPAGGRYSTGVTKDSIDTNMAVEWEGLTATIKVGFDFSKSGLNSIFLMYGTPRMKPVKGLKNAIYGAKTKKEIAEIQERVMRDIITGVMEV